MKIALGMNSSQKNTKKVNKEDILTKDLEHFLKKLIDFIFLIIENL